MAGRLRTPKRPFSTAGAIGLFALIHCYSNQVRVLLVVHFNANTLRNCIVLFKTAIGPTHHLGCQTRRAKESLKARAATIAIRSSVALQKRRAHASQDNGE
mmetsp:Transcript_8657/g.17451  ORF Transcript_8657/g.17451 Transcript_8657/m.17451 type:complete len:101 (-) Transcript_8657:365-667(-)